MEINQLKAFDHVIRLGSFSKAARYLNVSQPTISIRIKELEKSVGGALFYQSGKQMKLTELGNGFLPYARQALDVLIKGVERAQLIKEGKMGEVTVGTLPTFTNGIFSSTIADIHEKYPDINVAIHTGHNQQIIEMLYDGSINLGFMTHPFFNSDLKKLCLIKEPLLLVAHKSHQLSNLERMSYTLEEVFETSKPYILVDWSDESKHWQRTFLNYRMDTLELPPATALDLVSKGKGVSLLTETLAKDLLNAGTIVKLEPADFPELFREVAAVSLESEHSLSPSAQSFLTVLKDNIK
ncbi:LysR family transcriptional regulator [Virgibacillus flavescens]|uniref:LysR family transcriptional regulator n=1 Tax=Virgibacillus flavescens TaxID=1611422 RepID=UPI003D34AD9F